MAFVRHRRRQRERGFVYTEEDVRICGVQTQAIGAENVVLGPLQEVGEEEKVMHGPW